MIDIEQIPFVLTAAERSEVARYAVDIERHKRRRNAIEERQKAARIAGEAAREHGLTVEGER
jgi:hypothetical protein